MPRISLINRMKSLHTLRKNLKYVYDRSDPPEFTRSPVPQDKISWTTPFAEYSPTNFTATNVLNAPPWADKQIGSPDASFHWNHLDGRINRVSYEGNYQISDGGYPLNPAGRTGISGRGYLGKWACNHAVDCLITRLKPESNDTDKSSGAVRPSYQFIGIQRRDTGDWAIPGGMVDDGEDIEHALKREFMEEVLDSDRMSSAEASRVEQLLSEMFDADEVHKTVLYQGYVDDPRNTDNAWMETCCINIKCSPELEQFLRPENLKAGSDASAVSWIDIVPDLQLYASHVQFINKFLESTS